MAAPSAARATVWGPRSSGVPPSRPAANSATTSTPLGIADGRVGHQGGNGADQAHPDPQLVELAGTEPVGGHHRPAQDVHHRLVGRRSRQAASAKTDQLGVELPPHHVGLDS